MKSFRAATFSLGISLVLFGASLSCSRAPVTGREQLNLVSNSELKQMGDQAWEEVRQSTPRLEDPAVQRLVMAVADRIVAVAPNSPDEGSKARWSVAILKNPQANAFALPGNHIAVYSGILPICQNEAGLAAVLGHEIGHVVAHHAAERVSQQLVSQGIVTGVVAAFGSPKTRNLLMGALGLGAELGVLLPYSRRQEQEADEIGVHLMAQAGYDPHEALDLWKRMAQAEKDRPAPPAFLSDHPSTPSRIAHIETLLPKVAKLYVDAPRHLGIGEMIPQVASAETPASSAARRPAAKRGDHE